MDYKQFQNNLADEVRLHAGQEIGIRVETIIKNNGIRRQALEISDQEKRLYPSIYMEPYYSSYQEGVPLSRLADRVLEQCAAYRSGTRSIPGNFFSNYETIQERVFCKLINYEKNRHMLEAVPHSVWNDLALVAYYLVEPRVMKDASILIRQEHIARWGISEETLLENAWTVTLEQTDTVFRPLSEILEEMGSPIIPTPEESTPLYILTNESGTFGSVLIAEPSMLAWIADQIGENYYILPSSIHECLILGENEAGDENMLLSMVREINHTQVSPQEVLSDNIYYYDRKKGEVYLRK